ncbi:MAG: replication initiation protein, partial [Rhizobacter sp.]
MMDPTAADPPLRKPVNTLAIVPTKSSKITVLARKAYNVLLYLAQEQGIDHEVYRAPLQSVLRGIDFNSHAREIVKQHLRAMVSTTVEWQSPTSGEGEAWNVAGLLAHAKLYK